MNNSISGAGSGYSGSIGQHSFYNPNSYKKKLMGGGMAGDKKKIDKKKALPVTKKFPELKLMINGEHRNNSNSLSSDDENLNVSIPSLSFLGCDLPIYSICPLVPSDQEVSAGTVGPITQAR